MIVPCLLFATLSLALICPAPAAAPLPEGWMEGIKSYQAGASREPLHRAGRMIAGSAVGGGAPARAVAAQLAGMLSDADVSQVAKAFICGQLRLVGTSSEVPALAVLIADPSLGSAAVEALEMIPGAEAQAALEKARTAAPAALRPQIEAALGRRNPRAGVAAALKANPTVADLLEGLKSADPGQRQAAARAARVAWRPDWTAPLAGELNDLPADSQIRIAALLADGGAVSAVGPLENLVVHGTDDSVRLAAIRAVGVLGGAGSVKTLLVPANSGTGAIRLAVQDALERLHGDDVATAMTNELTGLDSLAAVTVLTALGGREESVAIPVVLALTRSGDSRVRQAAIRAAGRMAGGKQMSGLLAAMVGARSGDLALWEKALGTAVTHRDTAAGVQALTEALPRTQGPLADVILAAMGSASTPEALAFLRAKLDTPDAGMRRTVVLAFGRCQNFDLIPDLLRVASTDADPALRKLALRTLADLVAGEFARLHLSAAVSALGRAIPAAADSDDRRALLGALSGLRSTAALELVEQIATADPAVAREADAARNRLSTVLGQKKK